MGWTTKTWSFTANSSNTTLEFSSLLGPQSNYGPALDNVRVTSAAGGGAGCASSISPASASMPASGGAGSVAVTAASGCSWTATTTAAWITITSGASGSGNGTAAYIVATNTAENPRTATITVAGQTFTLTQASAAAGCTFGISPESASLGASPGSGNVTVTTGAGCSWTAASNANWISLTGSKHGMALQGRRSARHGMARPRVARHSTAPLSRQRMSSATTRSAVAGAERPWL